MLQCTAAEIAEKRRIAMEKLAAKKALIAAKSSELHTGAGSRSISQHTPALISKPTNSFYKSSRISSTSKDVEFAGTSSFLNDLKQNNVGVPRKTLRDAVHPYQRVTTASRTSSKTTATTQSVYSTPQFAAPSSSKHLAPVFTKTVTCKVYMVSVDRFSVLSSGYHEQLINVFKSIPSKFYANLTRIWSFALTDYELLQERVKTLKPDVDFGIIPKKVIRLCRTPAKEMDRSCLASIEPTLAEKLFPFQQEGVCFSIAQSGRIMICDEMGLGKTYQALAIADFYKEDWPLFICTTASVRDSWSAHIRQLLPNIPLSYVQVLTTAQQYFGDAKILITSYNMMEKHCTKLQEQKFGVVIFDESHTLKNSKAKCTVVADRLAKQAKRIILLSGTPALSRPLELFTQLQMIDRNFMKFMDFTTRYCDGKQTNFGWNANGQSNLEELNVLLKLRYIIRRTKLEVLPEMVEKFRETVVLDPALVWSHSDDTKKTLDNYAKIYNTSKGREREEILLQFYAQTAEVKTRAVCAYLKTLIKDNIKFIIFAHHRIMLDAICECLIKRKVNFVRIDGSTKNETRAEHINTFQKKSSCKVAVLSLRACNSGITLTAAEMIVFAELDWNPSTLAQAESRAHRIGQEKPVICRYLMATKTADDLIWNMLKAKQDVLNSAGLFCDNLQDATHSAAPISSKAIDQYFSPDKVKSSTNDTASIQSPTNHTLIKSSTNNTVNGTPKKLIEEYFTPDKRRSKANDHSIDAVSTKRHKNEKENHHNIHLSKELENIDDIFQDEFDINVGDATPTPSLKTENLNIDVSKELENIEDFFQDDDDDAFKDLIY